MESNQLSYKDIMEATEKAFNEAFKARDADRLRALLASPEAKLIRDRMLRTVAQCEDWRCLDVAQMCGYEFSDETWQEAAYFGNASCLAFALNWRYWLSDRVLHWALVAGDLACVNLLVQHGLPDYRPFMYFELFSLPPTMECLQFMYRMGISIDPASLIAAAACGDLDFVRWLHRRGVPLWRHPREVVHSVRQLWWEDWTEVYEILEEAESLPIPSCPYEVENMWSAMRYGSIYGAPVPPCAEEVFEEKRQQTRAVLRSFHATRRLCKAPGCPEKRRTWNSMAAIPSALIFEILIFADMEIRESMMPLPHTAPALALQGEWGSAP